MMRASLKLLPTIAGYKFSRRLNLKPSLPISITVSITNLCNSRCRTCFIWKLYRDHSELREKEFKIWEFERIFESIGKKPVWFTLSGGEPYLRHDLEEICTAIYEYCSPYIITIPTNALAPTLVEAKTKKILERCNDAKLVVNLSLDGVGEKHDEIRGIIGNFSQFIDAFHRLRNLKKEFPNLNIGVHSVISKYNISHILQLYEFVRQLDPDSYISEVAEERTELFNLNCDITPDLNLYNETIDVISEKIKKDYLKTKGLIPKFIQAFRVVYYQKVTQGDWTHGQVIPCYAGYASCHITPYGDVWPCCVLGYDKPMGNLREVNYRFKKVWFSKKADDARNYIKAKKCACPLANAHYTNILCSFQGMLRVFQTLMNYKFQ